MSARQDDGDDRTQTAAMTGTTQETAVVRTADTQVLALAQIRDPARYLILGEHGRGGLGRVSRAHDRELGRDVAIKELISRGESSEIRFLREALITARLEHPGIVAVHEAGRWPDGTPFYAMKLVSGRSLRELVIERKTAEERLGLLHHVIAVTDAIAYAHRRHIVHRDLKPANVIVGELGETVVIDWGLAKDLNASDEPELAGGSPRAARDGDLTVEGMVLGTPAYMAPEQRRGEPVDERADVYAIGVMLWELCALPRSLPSDARHRQRMLRRAGIDRDLAAIIDKALESEPARRYPDAGALGVDLEAFTSGARIAARHYTLFALLAHWIRRHRALALSVLAAITVAAAGIVVFVRNIAIERDRAAAARESASIALARVETSNSDLTLEHAELLLHTDPTAAVAALAEYRGSDRVRRRRLLAEARGRGVARAIFTPHSDTIWFAYGDASGAIVTVGEDRRIQLTRGTTSMTLATDVSTSVRVAYAPSRRLVVYATSPAGIAILDLAARTTKRITTLDPDQMELSPDGSRLAATDGRGELVVWSLERDPVVSYRAEVSAGSQLRFATASRLVVLDRGRIRAIALDAAGGAPAAGAIADVTALDARADAVAAGTTEGSIVVLSSGLVEVSRGSVCRKRVRSVRFIPGTDRLTFACQDRVAGIAGHDPARRRLAVVDNFDTRGLALVTPDITGRYVAVTDESHTAYLYDTRTRLVSQYEGNAGQPTYVAAPTAELDRVLIGDVNGTVRMWDAPDTAARAIVQAPEAIFNLAFTPDGEALVTGGGDRLVRVTRLADGATTELSGHGAMVFGVRVAREDGSILSYSYDGTLRVWQAGGGALLRRFADHGSVVEDADFIEHGRRVVSVGDDGRLLAWSPRSSDVAELFRSESPLTGAAVLAHNDHVVIKDAAGSVWDVSPDGKSARVRDADRAEVTRLRASADGRYVATGTDTGVVTVYDARSWRVVKTITAGGSIRQIQFDPMTRDLLVASEAGHTQFGHVELVALDGQRALPWRTVAAEVRDVAYAPDGELIGFVCADGGTWLYSVRGDVWVYTRDHHTDTFSGRFSPDGRWFASIDRRGVVVVRDLRSTFETAMRSTGSSER